VVRRALATLGAVAGLLLAPAGALAHGDYLTVRTDKGAVHGLQADGVGKFLGVPFAAPPVGSLRWQPPAPAARWHGVRAATAYGPRCPQLESSNGAGSANEDCLYLNVFRPPHARRAPVLFWIHGGGLVNGAGDQHDGALMARENGIVVVSINYRLGVFGFLSLPGFGAGSGDYGLLDQQAAMRWVTRNARAFGGDPRRVSIAGESAGGFSTCANLVSPAVRGLFDGAIVQSGSCLSQPRATSDAAGQELANGAGCADEACLRALPAATLLAQPFDPTITSGGAELPEPSADAVAAGLFPRVPVMYGANRNEGRTFAQGFADFTRAQYEDFVRSQFGDRADAVLAEYPWDSYPSPYTAAYAIGDIWTDSGVIGRIGGCATQQDAATLASRTYFYEFDDPDAPHLNNDHPGYQWGAGHAMELAYMWPSFDNGIPLYPQLDAAQRKLSDEMVQRWGAFTRFGVPFASRRVAWPPYSSGRLLSLRPGGASTAITTAQFAAEHKCGFWASSSP
jgi:para-nitrobenzyl esterase